MAGGLAATLAVAAGAQVPWQRSPMPAPEPTDARSVVLVERRCSSALGEAVGTLYGNGTVRRKETANGVTTLWLGELGPEELQGFRERLRGAESEDLDAFRERGVGGDWIGRCRVELRWASGARSTIAYGQMDAHSLALATLLHVLDDLEARATQRVNAEELPADYRPRPGDILRRRDGILFEVVRFTADQRGVELSGMSTPLTIYLDESELRRQFGALVQRSSR